MTRQTVATTNARIDGIEAKLDQLIAVMQGNQGNQPKQAKKPEQPKEDEWLKPFPPYGTPAQRVEYDKLAERAKSQLKSVQEALGTKSIKCFIPVPKDDVTRMPHTIRWTASYSK